jgi:hypothetical protein
MRGEPYVKQLDVFEIKKAMKLYGNVFGDGFRLKWVLSYKELNEYLGRRPYTIRLSAGYMLRVFEHSPARLIERLRENTLSSGEGFCPFAKLERRLPHMDLVGSVSFLIGGFVTFMTVREKPGPGQFTPLWSGRE